MDQRLIFTKPVHYVSGANPIAIFPDNMVGHLFHYSTEYFPLILTPNLDNVQLPENIIIVKYGLEPFMGYRGNYIYYDHGLNYDEDVILKFIEAFRILGLYPPLCLFMRLMKYHDKKFLSETINAARLLFLHFTNQILLKSDVKDLSSCLTESILEGDSGAVLAYFDLIQG